MRCKSTLVLTFLLLVVIPASRAAWAQAWVPLGCRDVNWSVDRDVIRVGRRDGRFNAIRVRVAGNDVRVFDLRVVYGSGAPDDLPVRMVIPAGGQSGALDLRGHDRAIDRVEMIYERRRNFRGRARVCVDGRAVLAQGPGPNWVTLGCRDVNWALDRDVIRVDRRDGRFTSIRLRASGNDVRVLDLKVVYGSGAPDDIRVQAVIRAGSQSGPLDLRGHDRAIDRIEMIYASRPNFRGRAQICVDGRAA
jgi:hypothetical protein